MVVRSEYALDFESELMRENPWPIYHYYRSHDPVHWSDKYKSYFVFKYKDVRSVLLDPTFTAEHPFRATRSIFGLTIIDLEGDHHQRLKSVVKTKFSADQVRNYTPSIIEPVIERVLQSILQQPEADLIKEFALQIPIKIILSLVGFSHEDSEWFFRTLRPIIQKLDDPRASIVEAINSSDTLIERIKEKLVEQTLVEKEMIHAGCPYTSKKYIHEDELVRHILLLLVAGTETTSATIGNVLHFLFSNKQYIEQCKNDPGYIHKLIKEIVRWQPPLHTTLRFASSDVEIDGIRIPKGGAVQLVLASANRDPEYFEQPDEFNPNRKEQHLSFGTGKHACIGISLANKELEVAVRLFIEHCHRFELRNPQLPIIEGMIFRMPAAIHVRNIEELFL